MAPATQTHAHNDTFHISFQFDVVDVAVIVVSGGVVIVHARGKHIEFSKPLITERDASASVGVSVSVCVLASNCCRPSFRVFYFPFLLFSSRSQSQFNFNAVYNFRARLWPAVRAPFAACTFKCIG